MPELKNIQIKAKIRPNASNAKKTPFWQNLQANTMRKIESTQVELGGAFIGDIVTDAKLRDDIPALLSGLQHVYVNPAIRAEVFHCLRSRSSPVLARIPVVRA